MNDDRISELYKGEILDEATQDSARRRIHWLCSNTVGARVLDIGCNQGIVSILLGREGFEAVGVDSEASTIEFARAELEREEPGTAARIDFEVANGAGLPYPDNSFDTVVLGNLLQLLALPDRVLVEAVRVLHPGGRLLITAPFGLHGHRPDHRHTFFPDDLMDLLTNHVTVAEGAIVEGCFRVLCVNDGPAPVNERVRRDLSESAAHHTREAQEQLTRMRRETEELGRRMSEREQATRKALADVQKMSAQIDEARARIEALQSERSQLMERVRETQALTKKLTEVRGELRATQRKLVDLESANADLELARWRLAGTLQIEQWKLRSMNSRKWWRIGAALGRARRSPRRLVTVPFEIVSIVFDRLPAEPRPPRSRGLCGEAGVRADERRQSQ